MTFARSATNACSIAIALALTSLLASQPAAVAEEDPLVGIGAAPAPGPIDDPDARAGRDNLGDWAYPMGARAVRPKSAGVLSRATARGSGPRTQAAVEPENGATPVGTTCLDEEKGASDKVDVHGCWFLYRIDAEDDPSKDYYPVEFQVGGKGVGDNGLTRLKGRNAASNAENVRWDPGAAETVSENSRQVQLSVAFGPVTMSSAFTAIKGKVHPYTASSLFHSSWLSPSHRHISRPGKLIESGGMNIWAVAQGDFPRWHWGGNDEGDNTTWTAWHESTWDW